MEEKKDTNEYGPSAPKSLQGNTIDQFYLKPNQNFILKIIKISLC